MSLVLYRKAGRKYNAIMSADRAASAELLPYIQPKYTINI